MPSWLIDDPAETYLVLGLLALILGIVWWMNRGADFGKKRFGWVYGLIERRLTLNQFCAMGLTVIGVNLNKIFAHISDQFRWAGMSKESFRREVESRRSRGDVTEVRMWDFAQPKFTEDKKEATIEFMVKPIGSLNLKEVWYRCVATFVRDPDGKWRLKTFSLFKPQDNPATAPPIFPQ